EAGEALVQEFSSGFLNSRHTYRPGTQFTTWMYQIARHAQSDYFRKRKREVTLEADWDEPSRDESAPGQQLEADQETALLRRALTQLAPEKREVLVLSRFQGLRYEQIGGLLGCETGAVKVRVYRALRELREIFFEISGRKLS